MASKKKNIGPITVQPLVDNNQVVDSNELIADQALVPRNDETLAQYKKDPSRPVHPGSQNQAQGNPSGANEGLSSV